MTDVGTEGRKTTVADLFEMMRHWSASDFANAASGEHGEDLLGAIVGACGRAMDARAATREDER